MVGYMFSSFLQLAVESRDLSQAEKEITLLKAKQTHKMATFFYSKWQFSTPRTFLSCHFVNLGLQTVISISAWDKSRDTTANWRKLEHM